VPDTLSCRATAEAGRSKNAGRKANSYWPEDVALRRRRSRNRAADRAGGFSDIEKAKNQRTLPNSSSEQTSSGTQFRQSELQLYRDSRGEDDGPKLWLTNAESEISTEIVLAAFADSIHRGRRDKCGCTFALVNALPDPSIKRLPWGRSFLILILSARFQGAGC
jgi:hypothetical protein